MDKWISELKVGDKVIVVGNHYDRVDRVRKVTKTQIILAEDRHKYNKKAGCSIGTERFHHQYITEATDENVENTNRFYNKRRMTEKLQNVDWKNYDNETLEKIIAVLKS